MKILFDQFDLMMDWWDGGDYSTINALFNKIKKRHLAGLNREGGLNKLGRYRQWTKFQKRRKAAIYSDDKTKKAVAK